MISRMLLVWPRCVCWEYAEAQHRSTATSPIVDFSTAVSSGYYGSTGRSPAGVVTLPLRAKWDQVESPFRSNHLCHRMILSEMSATFRDHAIAIPVDQTADLGDLFLVGG
jgi:hypothetical protein